VQLREAATKEYKWLERDWYSLYSFGERNFWALFLSDYLQLVLFAVEAGGPDQALARSSIGRIQTVPTDVLTADGADAHVRLAALADQPAPAGRPRQLDRPAVHSGLPCGELITQDEIRRWLKGQLTTGRQTVPAEQHPAYHTARHRYPRPAISGARELQELAINEGVVPATLSDVDAWWIAADLALYRWELVDAYDDDLCGFVKTVTHDVFAAQSEGVATNPQLWDWQNLVDLHRYCYARLNALLPTILPTELAARRNAQSHLNYFAWALHESLRQAGDMRAWYAFGPELRDILCKSDPGNLTPAQGSLLKQLIERFGPCPI
jgi:hypothetical protein